MQVDTSLTDTAPEITQTITHVGGSIRTFGATLFAGTKELIEQVGELLGRCVCGGGFYSHAQRCRGQHCPKHQLTEWGLGALRCFPG
jgi:hypothetical protein